ncbi:MAG: hypothetical protein Q8R34_00440 [bacterium]|nr:hypothetical protein [bacterium]
MDPAKASKEKIPVFIFLDEDTPPVDSDAFDSLVADGRYEIKIVYFPSLFKSLGIFDFQVVGLIKKLILSDQYHIYKFLFTAPIFILLTCDRNFIKDAERGLKMQAKFKRQKSLDKKIIFNSGSIQFLSKEHPDRTFLVHVCHIVRGKNKKGALVKKMIQIVGDVLNNPA